MTENDSPEHDSPEHDSQENGNPARAVVASVDYCLDLAATWHAWDGHPIARTIDGLPSTWTPHKALRPPRRRRRADHASAAAWTAAGVCLHRPCWPAPNPYPTSGTAAW